MDSITGTRVASFGGSAGNSLFCGAASLNTNQNSSNANANIGARALSVIKIAQTYTFLTSR